MSIQAKRIIIILVIIAVAFVLGRLAYSKLKAEYININPD